MIHTLAAVNHHLVPVSVNSALGREGRQPLLDSHRCSVPKFADLYLGWD